MTLIKNCGLKTLAELDMARRSGASFVGFVHHSTSPRHLPLSDIAALRQQTELKTVVVMVNPTDAVLDDVMALVNPDYLQLHKVDAARVAMISERTLLPLIIGIAMQSPHDLQLAQSLEPLAEHMLLDATDSGSGVTFDWSVLKDLQLSKPWFLAGGLTAQNVGEAIRITGAPMVDVSSGLEDAPGQKSLEKIAAFNKAVLDASHV